MIDYQVSLLGLTGEKAMKVEMPLYARITRAICLLAFFICSAKLFVAQSPESKPLSAKPAVQIATEQSDTSEPPRTFKQRFYDYRTSTFSPWALFTPSLGAGISQARDFPPEWKQGGEGFGKRLASGYGSVVIENTITLGFSALDHEDLRYPLSAYPKTAILKRAGHAISYTFVPRKEGGGRRFGWSRLIGDYGAGFVANTWYPARHSDTTNALYLGSVNLAGDLGVNLLKEFIRPHFVFGPTRNASAANKGAEKSGS
jgi:hypothetical protein